MHRAAFVAHVLIHHQEAEAVLLTFEAIAAREGFQVAIGVAEQDVEGELLGEVAEFLAVCRADQFAQLGPGVGPGALGIPGGDEGLGALLALVVALAFKAQGGVGFAGGIKLGAGLGQVGFGAVVGGGGLASRRRAGQMGCTLGGVGVHHGLAVEPGLFQLLEGRPLLGQGAAARGKPGFEPGQIGDAPVVRIRMGSRGLGQGGFCAFPGGAQAGDAGRALAAGFVQGGKAGAGLLAQLGLAGFVFALGGLFGGDLAFHLGHGGAIKQRLALGLGVLNGLIDRLPLGASMGFGLGGMFQAGAGGGQSCLEPGFVLQQGLAPGLGLAPFFHQPVALGQEAGRIGAPGLKPFRVGKGGAELGAQVLQGGPEAGQASVQVRQPVLALGALAAEVLVFFFDLGPLAGKQLLVFALGLPLAAGRLLGADLLLEAGEGLGGVLQPVGQGRAGIGGQATGYRVCRPFDGKGLGLGFQPRQGIHQLAQTHAPGLELGVGVLEQAGGLFMALAAGLALMGQGGEHRGQGRQLMPIRVLQPAAQGARLAVFE